MKVRIRATDADGNAVERVVEAESRAAAVSELQAQKFTVTAVTPVEERPAARPLAGRVSADDLVLFNTELASIASSGASLVQGLEMLARDMRSRRFRGVMDDVVADLRRGVAIEDAFGRHPGLFPPLYTSLVKAGVVSGNLPGVLLMLAEHSKSLSLLRRRLFESAIYPCILLAAGAVVALGLIPLIAGRMTAFAMEWQLDLQPGWLYGAGTASALRYVFVTVVGLLVAGLVAYLAMRSTGSGREALDGLKFRLPGVGQLFKLLALARFCRTFALLLRGGVPILSALDVLGKASGSPLVEAATADMARRVSQGTAIASALERSGDNGRLFPQTLVWMVGLGEKQGNLPEALLELAALYEEQAERQSERLQALLPPILAILVGVLVVCVILALILPVFQMLVWTW